jgi:hypothetical protein
MHDDVLAVGAPGYQLTVRVPSYPFGTSTLDISITTENGYTDHADVGVSGVTSWTFNIPTNQGNWVQVCVNSDNSSRQNCNTHHTTGTDMSVSLSPPSGNSDRYYIYPGNTYYIYPGYKHDYYFHHGGDHGFGGHQDGGNNGVGGNGGNQDSGNNGNNIGKGGNQNSGNNGNGGFGGHHDSGNIGNGGHQDRWFGGHQDSGNHGVAQPVNRLPHLSNGEPMMNAESSDDD